MRSFFIYILTNKNKTVLYTGVTNSLERRVWEHKQHAIPGFTKKYNCDRLIYFEEFPEVRDALAREKQIKGWLRIKKEALVATMNPAWNDLAADWSSDQVSS